VKPGDEIRRGQVIGYVGNTGLSQAAHLHYEILYHRNQINPINFFQLDLSKSEFEKLVLNAEKSTTLD
jgi:murein DD-endopeptidase MepM/ murein hydrolase activator NlpD